MVELTLLDFLSEDVLASLEQAGWQTRPREVTTDNTENRCFVDTAFVRFLLPGSILGTSISVRSPV